MEGSTPAAAGPGSASGAGSWTLKDSKEERGAEPDECYTVGRVPSGDDDRPDIAIEVVWTSGGIDKLQVYEKLGVREVWIFERESLTFFTLGAGGLTTVHEDRRTRQPGLPMQRQAQ